MSTGMRQHLNCWCLRTHLMFRSAASASEEDEKSGSHHGWYPRPHKRAAVASVAQTGMLDLIWIINLIRWFVAVAPLFLLYSYCTEKNIDLTDLTVVLLLQGFSVFDSSLDSNFLRFNAGEHPLVRAARSKCTVCWRRRSRRPSLLRSQ